VDNETWRRAWDLKVFGFISLCRLIYPQMAARKSGVIVNVIPFRRRFRLIIIICRA